MRLQHPDTRRLRGDSSTRGLPGSQFDFSRQAEEVPLRINSRQTREYRTRSREYSRNFYSVFPRAPHHVSREWPPSAFPVSRRQRGPSAFPPGGARAVPTVVPGPGNSLCPGRPPRAQGLRASFESSPWIPTPGTSPCSTTRSPARSTCAPPITRFPTWSPISTAPLLCRSGSPSLAAPTRLARRPAQHLRSGARRARLQVSPRTVRRQGCDRPTVKALALLSVRIVGFGHRTPSDAAW
jgi:hypothetical protein